MLAPAWLDQPPPCIPRSEMPQIAPEDLTALFEWLAWENIKVRDCTLAPDVLLFHQRVDARRIAAMPDWAYRTPILVSIEPWVLDGNHRAAAHKQRSEPVSCWQIVTPFTDAMRALFSFAGTTEDRG